MSKKTAQAIIESGNQYVMGVKKNQKKLYAYMEQHSGKKPDGWSSTIELNRGRREERETSFYVMGEEITKKWPGAKELVQVKRMVRRKGEISQETAYFLSSLQASALVYEYGIRSHWAIENSLHWVKDVTMREDSSKIRTGEAPSVLSSLRNVALNIFRKNGMHQIAKSIRLVSNDIERLCQLIL